MLWNRSGVTSAHNRDARRVALLALAVAVTAAAVLAMFAMSGCGRSPKGGINLGGGRLAIGSNTDYGKVEIRDYKGKKLSPVASEPDNSIKGPQHVDIATYRLKIDGLVKSPIALSYADVTSMHSATKQVDLHCVEGWSVAYLWQGVLLTDLLAKAGGADPSAKVLIFHCVDGYTSSLPLDYVMSRNIILGYKMNGVTMPPERGYPFQVVAEDRYGYKWAKWVKEIEVSSNAAYLGYWEKLGYDNKAVLPGKK